MTAVAALIAAAGAGTRLGRGPKAFLEIDGRSLLARVAEMARSIADEVVAAVPADGLERARALLPADVKIICGGTTRTDTFRRLAAESRAPMLLLLDVARPFTSESLARTVLGAAVATGAAGAFVAASVPAALQSGGSRLPALPPVAAPEGATKTIAKALPAHAYLLPQMPQAVPRDLLERAFAHAERAQLAAQTVWELLLAAGIELTVVPGEERNLKITTAQDWAIAQRVIAPQHIDGARSP